MLLKAKQAQENKFDSAFPWATLTEVSQF